MAKGKLETNYSIENIAQSIVRDNPIGRKYSPEQKQQLYAQKCKLLDGHPELKKLLSLDHLHSYPIAMTKKIVRLEIVPPEIVVVDSRIQDMCYLPYWIFYGSGDGSFGRCSGVGAFSCCPPFNLKAEQVQALMDSADIFIVLQSRPAMSLSSADPGAQFRMLNRLADEINTTMGRNAVVQKFAGGPCFACFPESCLCEGKCRAPDLKIPSLEGMGICVDQLCKDLAFLSGDAEWKISWIKGFSAPTQTPKKSKATVGMAIRLNTKF